MLTRGVTSWFFKMTGEDSLVTAQKEYFLQFLKSVSFAENVPAQISGTGLGTQNFLVPNASTTVTGGINSTSSDKPTWTVPPNWNETIPSQFLIAQFVIVGASDAKAQVNVSSLAGEGGVAREREPLARTTGVAAGHARRRISKNGEFG
jgi:hypothetical protein